MAPRICPACGGRLVRLRDGSWTYYRAGSGLPSGEGYSQRAAWAAHQGGAASESGHDAPTCPARRREVA